MGATPSTAINTYLLGLTVSIISYKYDIISLNNYVFVYLTYTIDYLHKLSCIKLLKSIYKLSYLDFINLLLFFLESYDIDCGYLLYIYFCNPVTPIFFKIRIIRKR